MQRVVRCSRSNVPLWTTKVVLSFYRIYRKVPIKVSGLARNYEKESYWGDFILVRGRP
jgi:hypothetical protein